MTQADIIFKNICEDILTHGVSDADMNVRPHWEDGTPAHTLKKFGVVNRYNLQQGFPLMTLRRTFWKSALDELLWIYQKKSNNVRFLGSHVWDEWADENGSIGKAYGYQMGTKHRVTDVDPKKAKELFGENGIFHVEKVLGVPYENPDIMKQVIAVHPEMQAAHLVIDPNGGNMYMDQVDKVLYDLAFNPASRRIITTTYIPDDLADMHLAPCAYSMTFNVSGNKLNAILNQRSQDMLAASNWNVVQYAFLLMLMAKVSGFEPGELVHVIADCHIYDRHVPIVERLINQKSPYHEPLVQIDPCLKDFYAATKNSIAVEGYEYMAFEKKIPIAV